MSNHKFQPVRGTKDLFGSEIETFNHIVNLAKNKAKNFAFEELQTPIFEFSEVFERNLGETSDIISKEVYKFEDRGGNFLTLRPEFTAPVVRALASNGELMQILPKKLFSHGPIFRYDRPQKGRQRQFHQVNFEIFGEDDVYCDCETIILAKSFLKDLGILEKTTLQINYLGDAKSKKDYENALKEYFSAHQEKLSPDSKIRLEKNVLRILDSKELQDIELIENAPKISAFYSIPAKIRSAELFEFLEAFGVEYELNERLVRGLDYYTSTVFEFVMPFEGAQNTVLAGGRYDDLVEKMSGKSVPAIGFAAGVERLMLLFEGEVKKTRPIFVNYVSDIEQFQAFETANRLRNAGFVCDFVIGDFKKQMKRANQNNARFVIIIGEEENENQEVLIKDFDSGKEQKVKQDLLIHYLEGKV
jgi:histidyl-tRNA synthetase